MSLTAPFHVTAPLSTATIAGTVLPLQKAEELVATLPGVISARIVAAPNGEIDEIHVLTSSEVMPKQTVRNIESALIAHLGLRVNHRKISVATSLEGPRAAEARLAAERVASAHTPSQSHAPIAAPSPAVGEARRKILFEDVEVRRSRSRGVLCRVTLGRGDEQFVGESEGQETERSRIELAARATLLALVQTVGETTKSFSLALEGSRHIDAFDREFVFVCITARIGRESCVLTGSCEVKESAETASALAVLDATNRWLLQMLP